MLYALLRFLLVISFSSQLAWAVGASNSSQCSKEIDDDQGAITLMQRYLRDVSNHPMAPMEEIYPREEALYSGNLDLLNKLRESTEFNRIAEALLEEFRNNPPVYYEASSFEIEVKDFIDWLYSAKDRRLLNADYLRIFESSAKLLLPAKDAKSEEAAQFRNIPKFQRQEWQT